MKHTGDNSYEDGGAFTGDKYWPIAEAKIPILDWGFLRSDANQDTVSVWNSMFFRLEDHLDRFLKNNKKLRFSISLNRQTISQILFELVHRCGFQNAYVQMLVTRGRPPIGSRGL